MAGVNRKTVRLTKQVFLDHLAQGMGVNEICRQYGYKGPSSVNRWRREDPEFNGAVLRILASPQHQRRMAVAGAAVSSPVALDDKDRFLVEYRTTRNRVLACDTIGKEPSDIAAWLDPESSEYDADFARKMDGEALRDTWNAEDVAIRKAILNQDTPMLRFVLPVLSPDTYGKVHQQKQGGNTLALIFSQDKLAGTGELLERLFASTASPADANRAVQGARDATGRDVGSGEVSGLLDAGQS